MQYDDAIRYLNHTITIEELMNSFSDAHFCFFGDYNLLHIKCLNNVSLNFKTLDHVNNTLSSAAVIFQDSFSFYGLRKFYPVNPDKGYWELTVAC